MKDKTKQVIKLVTVILALILIYVGIGALNLWVVMNHPLWFAMFVFVIFSIFAFIALISLIIVSVKAFVELNEEQT